MVDRTFPNTLIRKVFFSGEQAAECRQRVVDALDRLHGQIQSIVGQAPHRARQQLAQRTPEAAADVSRREAMVERSAVSAIAGTATVEDFERIVSSYLLCWQRARAALDVWAFTCRGCGSVSPRVAIRRMAGKALGRRLCVPCWKGGGARHKAVPNKRVGAGEAARS